MSAAANPRRQPPAWSGQLLLLAVPVAILAVVLALAWRRGVSNPVAPIASPPAEANVELRFRGVELRGRKEGTKTWGIWAKEVTVSRNQNTVFLKGEPHGLFYNLKDWAEKKKATPAPAFTPRPAGRGVAVVPPPPLPPSPAAAAGSRRRTMRWRAGEGEYTFANPGVTEQLILRRKVEIRTDENDVVTTEEVQWLPGDNRLLAPTRFKLKAHEGTRIEADRAESNTDLEVMELFGKVRFTVPIKGHQEL